MTSTVDVTRREMLSLLDDTARETRALLSSLDPERVIHTDERAWRVRDILGHLAVWNAEAARSMEAHAHGKEYHCIASEAEYYEFNGPAALRRRAWSMEQVWAEYDLAHEQLRRNVESLPAEKWSTEMLYPWNLRGTPEDLILIMMKHEAIDHCSLVAAATARDRGRQSSSAASNPP